MNYKQMLDKLADFEQRIAELEGQVSALRLQHIRFGPTTKTGCAVCGLGSDGPMGYACPRPDCPSAVRCFNIQDAWK